MADLGMDFDSSQVDPGSDFSPLPAGDYPAQIIDSVIKTTKSGTGQFLELVWEVTSGEFERRRLWQRVTLYNDSQQAQEIGQKQLSGVARACGIMGVIRDSEQMHFIECVIRVAVKNDNNGNPQNEVKSVRGAGDQPAPAMRQPAARAAKPPAAAAAAAPKPPAQAVQAACPPAGAGSRPWGNR